MTVEEYLRKQLDALQKFHPAYGGGLSIHLPMALTALYRLGAGEERLKEYFDSASSHLLAVPDARELFDERFAREKLGTGKFYPEYRRFFMTAISRSGHLSVLKDWLPILTPGITAHAFHSMIRLAYAIDIQHAEDIASSLAYWADMYQTLGDGVPGKPERNLGDFLGQLQSDPAFDTSLLPNASIHIKMGEVAKHRSFQKVLWALKVESNSLETLADMAARWYFCTGDFTALHGITSCHAMAVLIPFTADQEKLIQYYWQAFCAAYLTVPTRTLYQGAERFDEDDDQPRWERIRSEAVLKSDEHDIKLAYSCWMEQERYRASIYRKMASDRLGLTAGAWVKAFTGCRP